MKILGRIALVVAILASVAAIYFAKQLGGIRDGLKAEKAQLTSDKQQLTKDRDSKVADLANLRSELSKLNEKQTETMAQLYIAKDTAATREAEAKTLKQTVEEKTQELDKTKGDLASVSDELKKIKEVTESEDFKNIGQIREKLTAQTTEIEVLGKQMVALRTEKVALEQKIIELSVTPSNLRGSVAAVHDRWGFVVLDVGRDQRVQTNADFLVFRDSKLISKVNVQKVGQNTSVAEVTPAFQRAPAPRVGDQILHP